MFATSGGGGGWLNTQCGQTDANTMRCGYTGHELRLPVLIRNRIGRAFIVEPVEWPIHAQRGQFFDVTDARHVTGETARRVDVGVDVALLGQHAVFADVVEHGGLLGERVSDDVAVERVGVLLRRCRLHRVHVSHVGGLHQIARIAEHREWLTRRTRRSVDRAFGVGEKLVRDIAEKVLGSGATSREVVRPVESQTEFLVRLLGGCTATTGTVCHRCGLLL